MSVCSGKRVVVLGAGGSGLAAARLACREGGSVVLLDSASSPALQRRVQGLADEGIEVHLGWSGVLPCDLCVCSPGVPLGGELSRGFEEQPGGVISELEFGGSFCTWPRLAVTGTNGKTTVVEMLRHCLHACGLGVEAAGNIGLPLSALALERERALDWVVVEVSSFQLERTQQLPLRGAALLNVTPDHLNRHGTMSAYLATKLRLLRLVEPGGACVVRHDLLREPQVQDAVAGRRYVTFSGATGDEADYAVRDGWLCRRDASGAWEALVSCAELPFGGRHNYENSLAAIALGAETGVSPARLAQALRSFQIGPHRMEVICEEANGQIRYVDDSKATNLDALIQSVRRFDRGLSDIALIAGGVAKGCDLSQALPELRGRVCGAFLIGECRQQLRSRWGQEVPCVECKSLEEAVSGASACVRKLGGGTVLLAPGCASQDMFADYVERGRCFAAVARRECGMSAEEGDRG